MADTKGTLDEIDDKGLQLGLRDPGDGTGYQLKTYQAGGVGVTPTAGTPTHTADATVDNTVGGVTVLASNANRKAALIQCVSGGNVRVSVGGTPTTSTGIQLVPGGAPLILEATAVYGCPTGAIKAIREGASSGVVAVLEIA